MRVQVQMEREQRELGQLLATMGPDAAAVDVAGGGKAAGGGRHISRELLQLGAGGVYPGSCLREWPGARRPVASTAAALTPRLHNVRMVIVRAVSALP